MRIEYEKPIIEEEKIEIEDIIAASAIDINLPTDSIWSDH